MQLPIGGQYPSCKIWNNFVVHILFVEINTMM